MNITDMFIDGLYSQCQNEISEALQKKACNCLLDYLGVSIAGAKVIKDKEGSFTDMNIVESVSEPFSPKESNL